jgi:ligand-binding sensor protein
MKIIYDEQTTKYSVINNNKTLFSADSVEQLYSMSLEILNAFSSPVEVPVMSKQQVRNALDMLTNNNKG